MPEAGINIDLSKAPRWSVGMVALILSVVSGITAIYVAVRPEIQAYIKSDEQIELRKYDSVLEITKNHSLQILELSRQLGASQSEKQQLSARVAVLEIDINRISDELRSCQHQLENQGSK